jgi:hypothetical protein
MRVDVMGGGAEIGAALSGDDISRVWRWRQRTMRLSSVATEST